MSTPDLVQRFNHAVQRVLESNLPLVPDLRAELARLLDSSDGGSAECLPDDRDLHPDPVSITLAPGLAPGLPPFTPPDQPAPGRPGEPTFPYQGRPSLEPALLLPARYEDLGLLGRGGMGEVRRVRDRVLNRPMALKVIRLEMTGPEPVARFVEEAQATAQLQHPGIVPVHDLGQLHDGRYYFTMKEVQGRTLKEVIEEVHEASSPAQWGTAPEHAGEAPWTFRRLIDAFHKVCEAMAYAHARGVLHRDLKPSNIMVGAFGEVLVMDWGLAKVLDRQDRNLEPGGEARVLTRRSEEGATWLATQAGRIAGTPAYMPPEQARGEVDQLSRASDVYALGALLYEILSGSPPYAGSNPLEVLTQVLMGPPPSVRIRRPNQRDARSESGAPGMSWRQALLNALPNGGDAYPQTGAGRDEPEGVLLKIPEELAVLCERAMARDPGARPADAGVLAQEVSRWLEGAQRRERAEKVLEEVRPYLSEAQVLGERARALKEQATVALAGIRSYEPVETKLPGWELEDEAKQLEREAELKALEYVQGLRGVLTHSSDLMEVHDRLAEYYYREHSEAEARHDARAAMRNEVLLKAYDRRGEYAAYLQGDGALTLITDPPGAQVELYRYEAYQRRLVPRHERSLGRTPLRAVSLAKGSYLLKVKAPGCQELNYPISIGRGEHWDGVAPEELEPRPIRLVRELELDPNDIYVPAGWFWCGGDANAFNSIPRRRFWVNGFVMRRFPATNREYLEFLNDLLAQGREQEALRLAPRERASRYDELGSLCFGRDTDGHFILQADPEGDVWHPEVPIVQIDWWGAYGYCAWEASRSGLKWRLPTEREREKGGRGVDGRWYPWGDEYDATWASIRGCQPGRPNPSVVDSFPIDVSVYGLRGMGGNSRDWCMDVFLPEGSQVLVEQPDLEAAPVDDLTTLRVRRGGDWCAGDGIARCASRIGDVQAYRYGGLGVRLTRSF